MRQATHQTDKTDLLYERADHISVLKKLSPYIWPKDRSDLRLRVIFAFAALILAKIVTVLVPVAYKAVVDWFTINVDLQEKTSNTTTPYELLFVPFALILAYGLGRIMMVLFNQVRDIFFTKVGQHAVRQLSHQTFQHMHKLSLRFHLERRTGGLSRIVERGTIAIELIIRMGVLNSVPTFFELIFVTILMFFYFNWVFAAIILTTVFLYLWFTQKASDWRMEIRRELNDSDTDANAKAIDSLLNFETVKYFGNEQLEAKRFDGAMAKYEDAAIRTYTSLGYLNSGQVIIFTVGLTLCMLIAADGVAKGELTLGDFVMVNALLIQLYQPLNFMGTIYREIKQGLVDLENMFALLQQNPDVIDKSDAQHLNVSKGIVAFENVSFSYDPERPILKNISFEVPEGKMVAIVGPSGAGKSTISRLLFRFYDVNSGAIKIDGQNIRDVTQSSLRAIIGMVPQDTVLFNETIEYNIKYGRFDATQEEILQAAKLAQIDTFINTLPKGYNSMVGERGLKLSGGEKQRVAIARTLLKNPPVLMLDEATSALDSQTEKDIQDALDQAAKNRTTLVIAHRLSTIVHADEIIVINEGEIVERGNHITLIDKNGLYADMWTRQRKAEQAREQLASALEDNKI
ncbi:MAG: ABC transporter ATP-binding protein/permease [Pseudomonadota bacterium]